jgi:hypothetical protein
MFFHHPNPAKLAANQDLHGLFVCVTGKDQAIAKQAAPLLAALVDDFDEAPGTHEVLRDLESDAQPMAVHALCCILRHDFSRNTHMKWGAALALYRLRARADLERVFTELRNSEHAGKALHAKLTRDLLGAAVRAHDPALGRFLMTNGQFASADEAAPGFELLRSEGGAGTVEALANDPAVFSPAVREAGARMPS